MGQIDKEGLSRSEAAKRFNVSIGSISNWRTARNYRRRGLTSNGKPLKHSPKSNGHATPSVSDPIRDMIRREVRSELARLQLAVTIPDE